MRLSWVSPILRAGAPDGKWHLERRLTGTTVCGKVRPSDLIGWNVYNGTPPKESRCPECAAKAVVSALTQPPPQSWTGRMSSRTSNLATAYGMSAATLARKLQDVTGQSSTSPSPGSGGSSEPTPGGSDSK